ncbi:toxin [Actinomyces ruminis]|uniref:Toxin n=1 Tax=Actinomyces ruminis TaxID=1937003 RepID=A0ABX4MHQ6_9ACTO|nr:toxin [Actinomyces ruminis]PHP53580.1 toxin [Actinomyces ruminis]
MPDIHRSARKHYRRDRLDDDAVQYAAVHVPNSRPLDDEDDPRRWLMIGADRSGRLLELVVLIFDDGYELLIHAMKARAQYLDEVGGS